MFVTHRRHECSLLAFANRSSHIGVPFCKQNQHSFISRVWVSLINRKRLPAGRPPDGANLSTRPSLSADSLFAVRIFFTVFIIITGGHLRRSKHTLHWRFTIDLFLFRQTKELIWVTPQVWVTDATHHLQSVPKVDLTGRNPILRFDRLYPEKHCSPTTTTITQH